MEEEHEEDMEDMAEQHSERAEVADPAEGGDVDDNMEVANENQSQQQQKVKDLAMKVFRNEGNVDKIAHKMPIGSLWNLRRTCSVWNNRFIPHIKENDCGISLSLLSLEEDTQRGSGDLTSDLGSSSNIPFASFAFSSVDDQVDEQVDDQVDEQVDDQVDDQESEDQEADDSKKFENFMLSFGRVMTKLELNWRTAADLPIRQLREIVFALTPNLEELKLFPSPEEEELESETRLRKMLPKLKMISVDAALDVNTIDVNPAMVQLVYDVIQNATELNCLQLFDGRDRLEEQNDDFLETVLGGMVNTSESQPKLHVNKLKTLVLSQLKWAEIQILIQLASQQSDDSGNNTALALQSFTAVLFCAVESDLDTWNQLEVTSKLFHEFLSTQSPTLKDFMINFEAATPTLDDANALLRQIPIYFPRMEKVEYLQWILGLEVFPLITGIEQGSNMPAFTLAGTFPELKHLEFIESSHPLEASTTSQNQQNWEHFHHPGLKKLELKLYGFHSVWFTSLGSAFPSLTKVDLNLGAKHAVDRTSILDYSKLWTTWPGLTSLKLTLNSMDLDLDSFITGVARGKFQELKEKFEHLLNTAGQDALTTDALRNLLDPIGWPWLKFRKHPCLSDLAYLQEVCIELRDQSIEGHGKLTDIGGYFGLAVGSCHLQRLSMVSIHGRKTEPSEISDACRTFIRKTFGCWAQIDL